MVILPRDTRHHLETEAGLKAGLYRVPRGRPLSNPPRGYWGGCVVGAPLRTVGYLIPN